MNREEFEQNLTREIQQMCEIALTEDLGGDNSLDITAELIHEDATASAKLVAKESGILCGTRWLETIFQLLGGQVSVQWQIDEGEQMKPNQTICILNGNARQLLTGERSAMNFLQSLSSTATITQQYVNLINNADCKLLDTRKTIPGMRFGQKYAVSIGGGQNHRIGLSDAYLIKENHIMACGSIANALGRAIQTHPNKLLEIEVETLDELEQAIRGKAQIIMLDNFTDEDIRKAVEIRNLSNLKPKLEASGNVNINTITDIAQTGVDYISVGALTKDIKAIDLSMRISLN